MGMGPPYHQTSCKLPELYAEEKCRKRLFVCISREPIALLGVAVAGYSPIKCIWHSFGTLVNLNWVATSVASAGESACPSCATCGAADDAERTGC